MGDVAYTIGQAAASAEVQESDILGAIRSGSLAAHVVRQKAIILRSDVREWVRTLPDYSPRN
jgi:hypothetical protein